MFAMNAMASLHKGIWGLVVDGGQRADVADKFIQQGGLNQVGLLWDQRLLRQHHLFSRYRVSGQQTPVDVAAVSQVRVIRVLRRKRQECERRRNLTIATFPPGTFINLLGSCINNEQWMEMPRTAYSFFKKRLKLTFFRVLSPFPKSNLSISQAHSRCTF